jgi:hypothetical protein
MLENENLNEAENSQLNIGAVSGSLPDRETVLEPIQNALYATGMMGTEVSTDVAKGILAYLYDAGFEVRWRQ